MVSRDRKGDAVTATRTGQALHRHGDTVIKDQPIFVPYPPQPLCGCGFKETDRTCNGLLGLDNHPCAYGNNRVASLSIALRKSLRYDSTIKMYFVPSHWTPGCGCELSMAMVQFFLTKYSCARP